MGKFQLCHELGFYFYMHYAAVRKFSLPGLKNGTRPALFFEDNFRQVNTDHMQLMPFKLQNHMQLIHHSPWNISIPQNMIERGVLSRPDKETLPSIEIIHHCRLDVFGI